METIYDCVVVANGSFPQTAGPLELLKSAPAIIACDGAVQNLHERGLEPTAIVGDLDSIAQEMLRLYADRIHTVEDQEINDQSSPFCPHYRLPETVDPGSYRTS